MKVFGDKINDVGMANLLAQQEFQITDGSKLIDMILDNAYYDPERATCREIMQNASEVDDNFTVHFPTMVEPWLGIIDNGTGLPKDDLILYASGIGASTKDGDNSKVGGFGLGWKVPFTITDQYMIIDRYEGLKYTFSAYKDEYGKAQFIEMHEPQETDEPNGIEVRIPIKEDRFNAIIEKTIDSLRYFTPKPSTNKEVEWITPQYQTEGDGWGLNLDDAQSRLIMGNLWYPLDADKIRDDDDMSHRCPYYQLVNAGIDIYFDIGEIKLPMSREDIIYNDSNLSKIRAKLDGVKEELLKEVKKSVADAETQWEAQRIVSSLSGLVNRLGNKEEFFWNTIEINKTVRIEVDGVNRQYYLDPSRFELKSLSLSNYSLRDLNIAYTDKPTKVVVVAEGEVRVPSRLKEYYLEKRWDKAEKDSYNRNIGTNVYVLLTEEKDIDDVMEYMSNVIGMEVVDFRDVPEYKNTAKALRKKGVVRKLLIFKHRNRYIISSQNCWEDVKELDLNNSGGIYVDLRNRRPINSNYVMSLHHLNNIMRELKTNDIIPEDTKLYGCPGSVKNKLKDHPNFTHIDEVIDLAAEIAEDLGGGKVNQWRRLSAVKDFVSYNSDLFREGIGLEGSIFNTYKNLGKKEIDNDEAFKYYVSVSNLIDNIDTHPKRRTFKVVDCDRTPYEKMFWKKYPLLEQVSYSKISSDADDAINDYIFLKETCNV
jgi:hypothetical protein